MRCPYLQDNRCSIYPVRPMSCRLQGNTSLLPCKYTQKLLLSDKKIIHLKHMMTQLVREFDAIGIIYGTKIYTH